MHRLFGSAVPGPCGPFLLHEVFAKFKYPGNLPAVPVVPGAGKVNPGGLTTRLSNQTACSRRDTLHENLILGPSKYSSTVSQDFNNEHRMMGQAGMVRRPYSVEISPAPTLS
jgi:hypothetical protein